MVMENDDILKVKNYLTDNEVKGIYSLVFNKNNNASKSKKITNDFM